MTTRDGILPCSIVADAHRTRYLAVKKNSQPGHFNKHQFDQQEPQMHVACLLIPRI